MTDDSKSFIDQLDHCLWCDVRPEVTKCKHVGRWYAECPNCGAGTVYCESEADAGIEWNKAQRKARAAK